MSARARSLAVALRRDSGIECPPVPSSIVEKLSTRVWVRERELPRGLSGALVRDGDYGAVIWLRAGENAARHRFTLFHEVGHLLLHTTAVCFQVDSRRANLIEREADSFAVELLMPKQWLWRDLAVIGSDLPVLAARYGVSTAAMRRRFKELGL